MAASQPESPYDASGKFLGPLAILQAVLRAIVVSLGGLRRYFAESVWA